MTADKEGSMQAIINRSICPLYDEAAACAANPGEACVTDEALLGMTVEITGEADELGRLPIKTFYGYPGRVQAQDLVQGKAAESFMALPQKVVLHKNFVDVLAEPKVQGAYVMTGIPRGARLAICGEAADGWQPVQLPDGRKGYVCESALDTPSQTPCAENHRALRKALTAAARLYAGTQYRWGGKTPMGIDCSGLCSMAYLLCGIVIWRDAHIKEGYPIHEIPLSEIRAGDLLYFPGHVAMYLGGGEYIHSTGRAGDNGVTINSLYPEAPNYRADLPGQITAVGSYF